MAEGDIDTYLKDSAWKNKVEGNQRASGTFDRKSDRVDNTINKVDGGCTDFAAALSKTHLQVSDLTLEAISPGTLSELAQVAAEKIHDDDLHPFGAPWSNGTPQQRVTRLTDWYVDRLNRLTRTQWTLIFAIREGRRIIGSTNLYANQYPDSRTVSTGSWLILERHGKGIGTKIRRAVLELSFTQLGANLATSEAWSDNYASIGVNLKCGYSHVSSYPKYRAGTQHLMNRYELARGRWEESSENNVHASIFVDRQLRHLLF